MDTTSAPMNAAVAATLRAERGVLGLSLDDLEERTSIPKVSIQRYLAGTRPLTIDTLYVLAGALGMSLQQAIAEAQRRLPMFTADQPEPEPSAEQPDVAQPAPHSTTVTAEDIAAGVGLPRGLPRQRRSQPSSDTPRQRHS